MFLANLSMDRILAFLINIAIILALVHYVVIPLGRQVGSDITSEEEGLEPGVQTQLSVK